MNLVIGPDVTPVCDHCHGPWPYIDGRQLPGDYRWDGTTADGTRLIRLFCSTECADAE